MNCYPYGSLFVLERLSYMFFEGVARRLLYRRPVLSGISV
jgi:hypothetical protein